MTPTRTEQKKSSAAPSGTRLAVTWLDETGAAFAILRDSDRYLRRLFVLSDMPAAKAARVVPHYRELSRDKRTRMVFLKAGVDPETQLMPIFNREPMLFVEGKIALLIPDAARERNPGLTRQVERCALNHARTVVSRAATRATRGWHMLANVILNLPRAADSIEARRLAGIWKNRPAVLVGAGPSLDRNVHELARTGNRQAIVACDGALATLAQAGVVPDVAVSIDDTEKVWRYFAELPAAYDKMPVVSIARGCWTVIRQWKAPIVFGSAMSDAELAAGKAVGRDFSFDCGNCVGHAAFELARLVEADPVILVGFDLGYAHGRFHPQAMPAPYYHISPPPPENLVSLPGAAGEDVTTDLSMFFYLREFEERFKTFRGKIWDATEGGVLKAGAEPVALRAALDSCGAAPAPHAAPRVESLSTLITRAAASPRSAAPEARLALERWKTAADELVRAGRLPGGEKRGADEILALISLAVNPFFLAEHIAELDCAPEKRRETASRRSAERDSAAKRYETDALRCAEIVSALSIPFHEQCPDLNKAVFFPAGNPADSAFLKVIEQGLAAAGCECRFYDGDPGDFPRVWRDLIGGHDGIAVMSNGALFPAAWAIPGLVALDARSDEPSRDMLFFEQWLPGYAAICRETRTAGIWRETIPGDRPVFLLENETLSDYPGGRRVSFTQLASMLAGQISLRRH